VKGIDAGVGECVTSGIRRLVADEIWLQAVISLAALAGWNSWLNDLSKNESHAIAEQLVRIVEKLVEKEEFQVAENLISNLWRDQVIEAYAQTVFAERLRRTDSGRSDSILTEAFQALRRG